MTPRWQISDHAVHCYLHVRGWSATDANRDHAITALTELMPGATFRETDSQFREMWRSPKRTGGGLRWLVDTRTHAGRLEARVIWVGQGRPPAEMWSPES